MFKNYFILIILAFAFFACNSKAKKTPITDVEVATAFIRNVLNNDFKQAEQFLLKEDINTQIFERIKIEYDHKDKATLEKYKQADIIVNNLSYATDSVCLFNYSNSYRRTDSTILKALRTQGKWLIDLKYTFSENL